MPSATNEFPMPANLRPPAPPAANSASRPATTSHPTNLADALRSFSGQETFRLDPDLRPALVDMCGNQEWTQWLSQIVNDALNAYLRG